MMRFVKVCDNMPGENGAITAAEGFEKIRQQIEKLGRDSAGSRIVNVYIMKDDAARTPDGQAYTAVVAAVMTERQIEGRAVAAIRFGGTKKRGGFTYFCDPQQVIDIKIV